MSVVEPLDRLVSDPPIAAEERVARLQLARSYNVGPRTYAHLMRRYGNAKRALSALPTLAERGGSKGYTACTRDDADREIEAGGAVGAKLVLLGEPDYPKHLAVLDSAPAALWVSGDTSVFDRPAIALVGARNASALGMRTARRIASELGETGYVIVSGFARGIDTSAHEASLETGTIAVMAGGIDCIYPPENSSLAGRLLERGAIVAESPPGVQPTARHFPRRNRLISGLAEGVVLIEAAARSGSLITARFALEQGREAMACPGAPEDPRAAGCNSLIKDGAALIRDGADVIEALAAPRCRGLCESGREFSFDVDDFGDDSSRDDYDALSDFDEEGGLGTDALAEQIMELLGPQPVELDEIARICGVPAGDLSLAVLELDLAGRIELLPGGMIARNGSM